MEVEFDEVRSTIDAKISTVEEARHDLLAYLNSNVKSDSNTQGVLSGREDAYSKCIDFKKDKLESLLAADRAKLEAQTEKIKANARKGLQTFKDLQAREEGG